MLIYTGDLTTKGSGEARPSSHPPVVSMELTDESLDLPLFLAPFQGSRGTIYHPNCSFALTFLQSSSLPYISSFHKTRQRIEFLS